MKRKLSLLLIFIALAGLFLALPKAAAEAHAPGGIISWGVTPNNREQKPEPPAGAAKLLAGNNGMFAADTAEKKVWFTFDLGYEAGYTAEVLDILLENNIKAVFFLCGNYLKESALVRRMIEEGHSIGNHTDRHKDLPALPDGDIKKDITAFQEKFSLKYEGTPLKFFRPPQGRFCARTLREANSQGLKTLMWSIAIVDWGKQPINAAVNADKITSRLHPGAIILLHITNSGTPEMLRLLIPKVLSKGYNIGSPSEL